MANGTQITAETKAYSVTIFECECPHCLEVNRLADDDCISGAASYLECTSCHTKFPVRCE
jgi:transposase-like protein